MLFYSVLTSFIVLSYGGCPVSRCNWLTWESWSSCSRTCGGGTHSRSRRICCKADLDINECLSVCNRDSDDLRDTGICNTYCQNGGTFIPSSNAYEQCHCNDFYHGSCCEKQKKKEPNGNGQCSGTCDWTSWESWSTCSVSCGGGGEQERLRYLCCLEDYVDFQTCSRNCRRDVRLRTEKRTCGDICLRGGAMKPSGYGCNCLNRTFGHCCEQLLPGCTPFPTDVIFVLDSSASQTKEQFNIQLDFVNKFLDHVNISSEEFQIAVVTFSTEANVDINFNQSTDDATLRQLIREIKFRPGATFTDKGLKAALEVARKSERRKGMVTLTYAFVLTDGMSNKRTDTRIAATRLKNADVHVVAIGIGQEVSHQELRDIASPGDSFSPSYVFSVGDFNALNTLLKQLVQVTCDDCSSISHLSDIVFLLDESNEMSEAEFQLSVDIMGSVVQSTDHIGEADGPLFGLLQLGYDLESKIQMSNSYTQQNLLVELQTIYRTQNYVCVKDSDCSKENITSAIENICKSIFDKNGRQNSRKFLVVISSGRFQSPTIIKKEMTAFHKESDVKVFVIGPGIDDNMDGLLSLAKEANHVYAIRDKGDLSNLDVMQSEFGYNFCKKN